MSLTRYGPMQASGNKKLLLTQDFLNLFKIDFGNYEDLRKFLKPMFWLETGNACLFNGKKRIS